MHRPPARAREYPARRVRFRARARAFFAPLAREREREREPQEREREREREPCRKHRDDGCGCAEEKLLSFDKKKKKREEKRQTKRWSGGQKAKKAHFLYGPYLFHNNNCVVRLQSTTQKGNNNKNLPFLLKIVSDEKRVYREGVSVEPRRRQNDTKNWARRRELLVLNNVVFAARKRALEL